MLQSAEQFAVTFESKRRRTGPGASAEELVHESWKILSRLEVMIRIDESHQQLV